MGERVVGALVDGSHVMINNLMAQSSKKVCAIKRTHKNLVIVMS